MCICAFVCDLCLYTFFSVCHWMSVLSLSLYPCPFCSLMMTWHRRLSLSKRGSSMISLRFGKRKENDIQGEDQEEEGGVRAFHLHHTHPLCSICFLYKCYFQFIFLFIFSFNSLFDLTFISFSTQKITHTHLHTQTHIHSHTHSLTHTAIGRAASHSCERTPSHRRRGKAIGGEA